MKIRLKPFLSFLFNHQLLFLLLVISACTHEPFTTEDSGENPLPVDPGCTTDGKVCFESSILPIFQSSCARSGCHDAGTHEEGYILDSYTNIVKRGIKPGNANDSKLYKVLFETGEDRMPPDGSLTKAQKDSIALWINQGAANTTDCNCYCDPAQFAYSTEIKPILDRSCVGCHKPGALSGNIDLSTYNAAKAQATNGNLYGSVSHSTGYVPMPEGGKLSSCEIDQIKAWVDAGAPNN